MAKTNSTGGKGGQSRQPGKSSTETIRFPSSLHNKMARGISRRHGQTEGGYFFRQIESALDVEITKAGNAGLPWTYHVKGSKENVELAMNVLKSLSHDIQNLISDQGMQEGSSIGRDLYNELYEKLQNYIKRQAERKGMLEHMDRRISAEVHEKVGSIAKNLPKEPASKPSVSNGQTKANDDRPKTQSLNVSSEKKQNVKRKPKIELKLKNEAFSPRSLNQAIYYLALEKSSILFGVGPAGGGKTHVPIDYALRNNMTIMAIRPKTTTSGRDPGAVKGDESKKSRPFMKSFEDVIPHILEDATLDSLEKTGVLKYGTTDFIRGRTLSNTTVIIDEAQNLTEEEAKAIITRFGQDEDERTIFVFTGDISDNQNDLHYRSPGLVFLLNHLGHAIYNLNDEKLAQACAFLHFNEQDSAARADLMPNLLNAFNQKPSAQICGPDGQKKKHDHKGAESFAESDRQKQFRAAAESNRDLAEYFLENLSEYAYHRFSDEAFKRWPHLRGDKPYDHHGINQAAHAR